MAEGISHLHYIGNAEDLALLSEFVGAGHRFKGAYICLACDINLSDYCDCVSHEGWKPIGSEKVPFAGTFDGCGHVVAGLRINRPSEDYQGLFGCVSGVIKNIRLRNFIVVGRDFTGSVAGCVNGGYVKDARAIGDVLGCNMVGGIVGSSVNSVLETNRFQRYVAGRNYIGGISGSAWRSNIKGCLNMGSFVKGSDYVGGITGSLFGANLEGCRCTGHINGRQSVGGMAGRIEDGNVLGCTVACMISGKDKVGAAGGFACGNNLIENCVFACSVFDGTKHNTNIAGQVFTFDSDFINKPHDLDCDIAKTQPEQ